MSSNNWKKVLLYGGAGTAAVAFYLWRKASSYVPEPGTGGTFDSVFQKANAAALERQLNGETNTTPIKPLFRYAPPAEGEDYAPILILYGTEYGFSAELAKKLEDEIQKLNISPKLYPRIVSMEDYEVIEWDKEQAVLVICSTYGDGVPPSKARSCFDYMMDDKRLTDLTLKHTTFSVLALGDKGYPHFCRAGKTFDARLEELGGSRFVNRGEVDLEDWDVINRWISNIIAQLPSLTLNNTKQDYLVQKLMAGGIQKKLRYDRARPFFAKLVEKKLLTVLADGEDKETIHFEFELPEEGMQYIVGDSLGVIPINLELEVDLVLKALGVDGAQSVKTPSWRYQERDDEIVPVEITLHEALLKYFDLKNPKPRLAQVLLKNSEKIAENDQIQKLKELMKDGVNSNNLALNKYLQSREVVDVLNDFSSIQLTVEEFLDSLGQLLPRYYSISSSPNHDPKKVTITVAVVRYNLFSRDRVGVCSTYLSDRIHVGDKIPIFVNNNPDFRLPSDPALPILMVGPGTGIAPFRAMLQERVKLGATGSNTLYFGCRFSNRDYLYKEELENYVKDDKLILHTAFSREQKEKIYVQQRVSQTREHVWEVLEKGGHIYICGDAQYMAGDVHNALIDVVSEYGKVDHEGAKKYLEDLELAKRYQKDTWF